MKLDVCVRPRSHQSCRTTSVDRVVVAAALTGATFDCAGHGFREQRADWHPKFQPHARQWSIAAIVLCAAELLPNAGHHYDSKCGDCVSREVLVQLDDFSEHYAGSQACAYWNQLLDSQSSVRPAVERNHVSPSLKPAGVSVACDWQVSGPGPCTVIPLLSRLIQLNRSLDGIWVVTKHRTCQHFEVFSHFGATMKEVKT